MKNNFLKFAVIAILCISATGVSAQKLGHIDTNALLAAMPESTKAQEALKTKAEGYDSQFKEMQTEYQRLVESYMQGVEAGSLVGDAKTAKETELQELQRKMQQYEQNAAQELEKLQAESLNPILAKARKAIDDVSAANGFTYVFDTSRGALVYISPSSQDLLPLVKTKLGI